MKVAINFDEMKDTELISLAKRSIREVNDRSLFTFKVIRLD